MPAVDVCKPKVKCGGTYCVLAATLDGFNDDIDLRLRRSSCYCLSSGMVALYRCTKYCCSCCCVVVICRYRSERRLLCVWRHSSCTFPVVVLTIWRTTSYSRVTAPVQSHSSVDCRRLDSTSCRYSCSVACCHVLKPRFLKFFFVTLRCPLLSYGYSYKAPCARPG